MTAMRLIDAILVMAVVVVVPAALSMAGLADRRACLAAAAIGGIAAMSFALDEGTAATMLVVPWALAAGTLAFRQAFRFLRAPTQELPQTIAAFFLVVGAGWLVLSRNGTSPLGLGPAIVELTAVHFHYAGFAAPLVTLQLADWMRSSKPRHYSLVRSCAFTVLAATPITAAGITVAAWSGAIGAVMFAAALSTTAILTLVVVAPRVAGAARMLLATSALSVLVPMMLAVAYALGRWLPTPAPSLQTMVWTHGLLNALGFALCGVLGWTQVRGHAHEVAALPT